MLQGVQFNQPPPPLPNLSVPPPMPGHYPPQRFHTDRGAHRGHFFQPFRPYTRPGPGGAESEFDGKRLRKSVMRKTVDYNSAIIKMLESRVWQRDFRDRRALQPDVLYYPDLQPPPSYVDNPINSVTTRFVKTATNKMRCPIFCMAWTPEGRRLVTGASSGEFTLWNGLTFNFETILQAHDSPVRTMVWSHNDVWMVTGDHAGYVKYWQSNMNNVKMFLAHKEAIRGLSFSPTDHKFVTCSDDGTLRIWDFLRCHEERILRGHGSDVKCVHWHPQKGLIVSGSKDNQQPVKLWDPKTGQSLATLHAHKSTVMDIKWNNNGNWLVTASRDHLLKLFDLRNLSQEVQTFRGHKKEASSVAWHPYHEGLFCSGGSDGAILFWHVGADKEVGGIEQAHDSIVWTLAWHPLGHILCSGSNDHTSKFWTRNRPGDLMRDKYNLNTLPAGLCIDDQDLDEPAIIPGMGPEDKVDTTSAPVTSQIPGLDFEGVEDRHKQFHKKVPYSKPIPRNFQAQWNETGKLNQEDEDESDDDDGWRLRKSLMLKDPISEVITQILETNPPPGVIPLSQLQPQAMLIYGKLIPVEGNTVLTEAIKQGTEALGRLIHSGEIEELHDVIPHLDEGSGRRKKKKTKGAGEGSGSDDDMDIDTSVSDVELPAPLPSSAMAQRMRKSRFSDTPGDNISPIEGEKRREESLQHSPQQKSQLERQHSPQVQGQHKQNNSVSQDQDMRYSAFQDMDLRSSMVADQDLRVGMGPSLHDCDFRHVGGGHPPSLADEDLRQYHHHQQQHDEDLRDMPPMPQFDAQDRDRDFRQWGSNQGIGNGPRKRRWGDEDDDREDTPVHLSHSSGRSGMMRGGSYRGNSPAQGTGVNYRRGQSPVNSGFSDMRGGYGPMHEGGGPAMRGYGMMDRRSPDYNPDGYDREFRSPRNVPMHRNVGRDRGYPVCDDEEPDGYFSDDEPERDRDWDKSHQSHHGSSHRGNGNMDWGHHNYSSNFEGGGGYRSNRGRGSYRGSRGGSDHSRGMMRGGPRSGRFSASRRGQRGPKRGY